MVLTSKRIHNRIWKHQISKYTNFCWGVIQQYSLCLQQIIIKWWQNKLTFHSLTSISLFSLLFSIHFSVVRRRICLKIKASKVGNHFLDSHNHKNDSVSSITLPAQVWILYKFSELTFVFYLFIYLEVNFCR